MLDEFEEGHMTSQLPVPIWTLLWVETWCNMLEPHESHESHKFTPAKSCKDLQARPRQVDKDDPSQPVEQLPYGFSHGLTAQ